MRYFSMFSGIGGFEIGIQRAYSNKQSSEVIKDGQGRDRNANEGGDNVLSASRSAPLCVGFSEIDKYAVSIYTKHFKGHKNYGDAKRIVPEEIPDFDFLCGGFPCQAFSIAGKRGGFQDTRGTLFFEIARILTDKRPRNFLLENVKGLLSHDNGKTFQTILKVLTDIGYYVEWQVLNSKDFGVPQNRERVFIVGHLRGECGGEVFPIGESCGENNVSDEEAQSKIIDPKYLMRDCRVYNEQCPTMAKRDYKEPFVVAQKIVQLNNPTHSNNRLYSDEGISPALNTAQGGNRQPKIDIDGYRIRRLTPTECERLQGFPDGWTKGISDSQRYKCLGNAVSVPVIKAIAERLLL